LNLSANSLYFHVLRNSEPIVSITPMTSTENSVHRLFIYLSLLVLISTFDPVVARQAEPEPLGIALENFDYPWPHQFLNLKVEGKDLRMAYMDVQPEQRSNGQTVVLMHGKNFFGAYWEDVVRGLVREGYRVVVPDQIGFGKSSKPLIHYSFHQMGVHTEKLLDHLGVNRVAVVGHSMGGMVAARFALMYPDRTTHLVLENPIGLEDYRIKAPWVSAEQIYGGVLSLNEDRIRQQHEAYYVQWRDEYETYVQVHYRWTLSADYPRLAKISAITAQMLYEQPVIHEFPHIKPPSLLVIGQEDRTAPFRNLAEPDVAAGMGYFPDLGKRAASLIPDARLVELENVGHTPHFEALDRFMLELIDFLDS